MTQPTINTETLQKMLDQGQPVTLLDVRLSKEWAEWTIPGSINVDVYDALKANDPNALAGIALPGDRPVITI